MSDRVRSALTALVTAGGLVALFACGTGSPAKAASSGAGTHKVSVNADFNGDGYADLAVGAPYATVDGRNEAGYVAVMYGSAHGLSASHRTIISPATPGVHGGPRIGGLFGMELAKGDLDGDGYADLVIGRAPNSGMVVVWGGKQGLSSPTGLPHPETLSALGDFNGDGHLDMALFATAHSLDDGPSGTTETVWYGPVSRTAKPTATSTLATPSDPIYQVDAAATGDVNHDGRADLAVTAGTGSGPAQFRVDVYLGSAAGLRPAPDRHVPQGGAVALGDVNGDGYADLVAGAAWKQQLVIGYGSAAGISPASRWTTITQSTSGVPGARTANGFGASVAVGDVTGDGRDDIAVGAPGERVGKAANSGAVILLRGRRGQVTGSGAQELTQDTPGVPGTAEQHDYFGDSFGGTVQLLDVNANGYADLAVSSSKDLADSSSRNAGQGTVWLLRGRPSGLTSDAAIAFGGKTIGAPYKGGHFGIALG
ncbi:FG-GAP-like repeat-containing protein [Streptomyces sp. NPDC059373]